ncbi:MAG TPA: hypothetical protein VG733_00980 [Chthoniobacteraceae bacterium]|nr:hypothetical protein [Chthoniobacteraceae bacterium]
MVATIQKDFADWLSPMIVKELRQGMRARVFVMAFLLIQGSMIFSVMLSVAAATDAMGAREMADTVFWFINGALFLVVLPCRGFTMLSSETKGNMLELLFFTGLSATWVVLGKWLANVVQSLLIAISVLPYLVLRYYLGGIDVVTDTIILADLLFFSAMLDSVAIVASAFHSWFLKGVALAVPLLLLLVVGAPVAASATLASTLILFLLLGPVFLLMMFAIVTLRISTPGGERADD